MNALFGKKMLLGLAVIAVVILAGSGTVQAGDHFGGSASIGWGRTGSGHGGWGNGGWSHGGSGHGGWGTTSNWQHPRTYVPTPVYVRPTYYRPPPVIYTPVPYYQTGCSPAGWYRGGSGLGGLTISITIGR